jgi:acetyl-CoA C-acetyltransferase
MREVAILGIGQTPVDEHWDLSVKELAGQAALTALSDAGRERADSIYIGNMLSGMLSKQENLGVLIPIGLVS